MVCAICGTPLTRGQKSTCSIPCRNKYLNNISIGKPSPLKGKTGRWSDAQKSAIGDKQRGVPKSDEFKQKCSERMKGKPSCFAGKKHTDEWKTLMSALQSGDKHYNYQARGSEKSDYAVRLRREKFGCTSDVFTSLMQQQDGRCAICGLKFDESTPMHKVSADHNHETNRHRGLLCRKCNVMLGNAGDSAEVLIKAIEYLEYWKRTA